MIRDDRTDFDDRSMSGRWRWCSGLVPWQLVLEGETSPR